MTTPSSATFAPLASVLALGQTHTTLYVADPQFEHLGPRSAVDNPLVDRIVPSADRNLVSTVTAPVYVDSLFHRVLQRLKVSVGQRVKTQVLGDIPDTPCKTELTHFEKILDRHPLEVEGYDRGNHSSSNAYGVVNIRSRIYRFLAGLLRKDWLKNDVCQACGGCGNELTPKETMRGMHRILHRHHANPPPIEQVNTPVSRNTDKVAILANTRTPISLKPTNHEQVCETFWKPTPDASGQVRTWDALVNYQEADEPVDRRRTKATPFYIQAAEECRFQLKDGSEVPVYNISLDSLDNDHVLAVFPGVSALQVRLVEAFIERKLRENPNARFKLSSHFSSIRILDHTGSEAAKDLFRQLLSREEVVLFSGGHTHQRELTNLTHDLALPRKSDLMEVIVPSLVDYNPAQNGDSKTYQDARALVIETTKIEYDAQGRPALKIDLEFQGLDPEELTEGRTPEVMAAVDAYREQNGYMRAKETVDDVKKRHIRGFVRRRFRHLGQMLNPFRWGDFKKAWARAFSPVQALFDNFTVVSTVQMFNEVQHFIPFLRSLVHFMKLDETEPGEDAARLQIQGVLILLDKEYNERRPQFEAAVARGESAVNLKPFNDLYERVGVHLLPELFLQLKLGGQARAYAVLAGLEASREEYEYHRGRPTKVPNKIPTISLSVG